jgi:hypothetical protein
MSNRPDVKVSKHLWNVGLFLRDYRAQRPRRQVILIWWTLGRMKPYMCSFLQLPVASFLLGPDILLGSLTPDTRNLCCFHNERHRVSHPCKATCNTTAAFCVLHSSAGYSGRSVWVLTPLIGMVGSNPTQDVYMYRCFSLQCGWGLVIEAELRPKKFSHFLQGFIVSDVVLNCNKPQGIIREELRERELYTSGIQPGVR